MEKNFEYRSLCSTCKNAKNCTYRKDRERPFLYCEEFEIDTSPSVKIHGKEKISATVTVNAGQDSGRFIGLCSNCDSRKTCTFPKPEGGIWHCEEYR